MLNPEIPKDHVDDKGIVLDVLVEFANGTKVDLEMQVRKTPAFRSRAIYYWAKMFVADLERGEAYENLRPTISILFLDYKEFKGDRMHSVFQVLEVTDHVRFSEDFEMHVIELPKRKKMTALERQQAPDLELWTRFFKATTKEEMEAIAMSDPTLEKAKSALEKLSADPEARELARLREQAAKNYRWDMAASRTAGEKAGLKKGLKKGLEKGRKEGREQGRKALQDAVVRLCISFGIEVGDERRKKLQSLDDAELARFFDEILAKRAWPTS